MFWMLNCKRTYSLQLKTGCHFIGPLASSHWQPGASDTNSFFCRDCRLFLCSFPGALLVVGLLLFLIWSLLLPINIIEKKNNMGLNLHQSRTPFQCGGDPNPLSDHRYSISSIEGVCCEPVLTSVPKSCLPGNWPFSSPNEYQRLRFLFHPQHC